MGFAGAPPRRSEMVDEFKSFVAAPRLISNVSSFTIKYPECIWPISVSKVGPLWIVGCTLGDGTSWSTGFVQAQYFNVRIKGAAPLVEFNVFDKIGVELKCDNYDALGNARECVRPRIDGVRNSTVLRENISQDEYCDGSCFDIYTCSSDVG